jgi:hypothetical protein
MKKLGKKICKISQFPKLRFSYHEYGLIKQGNKGFSKKTKNASKEWLKRHLKDSYVKKAKMVRG